MQARLRPLLGCRVLVIQLIDRFLDMHVLMDEFAQNKMVHTRSCPRDDVQYSLSSAVCRGAASYALSAMRIFDAYTSSSFSSGMSLFSAQGGILSTDMLATSDRTTHIPP